MRRFAVIPVGDGPITEHDAPTFEDLRTYVGGHVERVRVAPDLSLVINEEGRLTGLPFNARASVLYGVHLHGQPIVGPVLLGLEAMVGDGIEWVDCPDIVTRARQLLIDRVREAAPAVRADLSRLVLPGENPP